MTEADARAAVRLFLALWPDARVREALVRSREAWRWPSGAALVAPQRLHLTLHFLGAVAADRLPQLRAGLAVPVPAFALRLDRPAMWPHGLAVLQASELPPALQALHAALAQALQRLGLPTEARALQPHVTLARRAGRALLPTDPQPIAWPVQGYVLAASRPDLPGRYQLLERYG